VRAGLRRRRELEGVVQWVLCAFDRNTVPWRWSLSPRPAGWGMPAKRRIAQVLEDADRYVQALNSRFTDPSGRSAAPPGEQEASSRTLSEGSGDTDDSAARGSNVVAGAPETAH
jgi:hypothetical protein